MTPLFVWVLIGSLCQGTVLKSCEPIEVHGPYATVEECVKAAIAMPPADPPRVCERRGA